MTQVYYYSLYNLTVKVSIFNEEVLEKPKSINTIKLYCTNITITM